MQFQHDWPKDKKLQLFYFLPKNLEKFGSTELYGAPPEEYGCWCCAKEKLSISLEVHDKRSVV